MGNCLFAQGLTGVTAELNVRFKQTIEPDKETTVKAWVKNSSNALYILESEIVQGNRVRAFAVGKFVDKPEFRNSQDK
jgi:acyl-CoA thioesterase FadM